MIESGVSLIVLALVGLVLGFLLIGLTARSPTSASPAGASEAGWIAGLSPEGFGKLLSLLFAELKFEVESAARRGDNVDLFAVNRTPITGARLYIRGVFHPPLGMVGEEEVRTALDAARAEQAGKAVVVTPGGFTDEARAAASGAPVDLVDGGALAALVKQHMPQVAAAERVG